MAEEEGIPATEKDDGMKPWEQHSGVIILPRYNYNAPASLLHHSHSGFLITCPIKREKSATKEAISILQQYVGSSSINDDLESADNSDTNDARKRRKTSVEGDEDECTIKHQLVDGEPSNDTDSPAAAIKTNGKRDVVLSLVKLTRSGLLLFTFPHDHSTNTVDIILDIVQSLESKNLKSPLWCHRIFPVQATCILNEKELIAVVTKLVRQFVNDKRNQLPRPLKFAVGYNRRGIEETEMKILKGSTNNDAYALLDRNKCFEVVASAVKGVVSDCSVDLKNPELSVLVELLPLSGVPSGSLVVAVSLLPKPLVSTKPKLSIKALLSDSRVRKG